MLTEKKTSGFMQLMNEHEQILSKILKQKPVKELYFNDFQGEIKSLGAWGGDFVMIVSELNFNEIKEYFSRKGIMLFLILKKW